MFPAVKGLTKEEHLFYGTVSHASIPSVFGGSNVPFFDKIMFQINGDKNATFVLYTSKEMLEDMSDWFSFAAKNANEIPLEIYAAKVGNRFIVHSLASTNGEVDFDTLVMDYQVYCGFIFCVIILLMLLISFVLLVFWLLKKRKV